MDDLHIIDIAAADLSLFKKHLADCVILTHDHKIFLQKHSENDPRNPGIVHPFGGHVEAGETAVEAVIREIAEETGAKIERPDLLFLGAVSEAFTNHTELVHVYYWHDRQKTITGCYERGAVFFDSYAEALAYPKLMDYARWALEECQRRNLLPSSD